MNEKDTASKITIEISDANPNQYKRIFGLEENRRTISAIPAIPEMTFARLIILVFGLSISLFIVGAENTITSSATPAIAAKFNVLNRISWIPIVYLLFSISLHPLFGKIAFFFGPKKTLLSCILIFLFGSLISGASKTFPVFLVGRGIAGVGGSGIIATAFIAISACAPKQQVSKYVSFMGVVLAISSLLGPLIGSSISQSSEWRWCYYYNIPLSAISFTIQE
ncbi:putative MFS-type transporter [Smittium mucronatum]|uniref:Putative MFS-type transporter n=1 Tax=Smittium mucronatum TaxID=133383 RepID=A0A1R0H8X6_9FUNG|nr:putative MFS-type transporter [Smittium mucronatum]